MVCQVTFDIEIAQYIIHVYELSAKVVGVTRYLLMRHPENHYGPLVTRLIRQLDRWIQQFHWYLLIDLITVRWSAARRGIPGSLIVEQTVSLSL